MNINIITLGRLKEEYLRNACAEYEKRLMPFAKVNLIELEPIRLPENPSDSQIETALLEEAEMILRKIPQSSYTISMCIEGEELSSEKLAAKMQSVFNGGNSTLTFVIGSSYGLSDRVKRISDLKLSMSKMTFPHQLARVMLYEQIYRGFTILNNKRYHK